MLLNMKPTHGHWTPGIFQIRTVELAAITIFNCV
jgi:hypothetical protein